MFFLLITYPLPRLDANVVQHAVTSLLMKDSPSPASVRQHSHTSFSCPKNCNVHNEDETSLNLQMKYVYRMEAEWQPLQEWGSVQLIDNFTLSVLWVIKMWNKNKRIKGIPNIFGSIWPYGYSTGVTKQLIHLQCIIWTGTLRNPARMTFWAPTSFEIRNS